MKIEVLGMGCPKCEKLYEMAQKAAKEVDVEAQFVKVKDINKIMNYGIMITPALAIDGDVKVVGRIPTVDQIKTWLQEKK